MLLHFFVQYFVRMRNWQAFVLRTEEDKRMKKQNWLPWAERFSPTKEKYKNKRKKTISKVYFKWMFSIFVLKLTQVPHDLSWLSTITIHIYTDAFLQCDKLKWQYVPLIIWYVKTIQYISHFFFTQSAASQNIMKVMWQTHSEQEFCPDESK